jgi:hypothetical protein
MSGDSEDNMRYAFAGNGFEYYLSARFSFLSKLHYIAGNLFHHAVEMFIKSGLINRYSINELKNMKHNLIKLWDIFIKEHGIIKDMSWENVIIRELDKFEKIRYPDFRCTYGMEFHFTPKDLDNDYGSSGEIELPRFVLSLAQMDKLIIFLVDNCRINTKVLISHVLVESLHYLKYENECSNRW